mmetsp:Transcript_49546/g.160574  ORF Transcript_49546/g.160574 Transcript_49546/m.160574 type:complete len:248 (+) Transcript_49546:524-1267(+)
MAPSAPSTPSRPSPTRRRTTRPSLSGCSRSSARAAPRSCHLSTDATLSKSPRRCAACCLRSARSPCPSTFSAARPATSTSSTPSTLGSLSTSSGRRQGCLRLPRSSTSPRLVRQCTLPCRTRCSRCMRLRASSSRAPPSPTCAPARRTHSARSATSSPSRRLWTRRRRRCSRLRCQMASSRPASSPRRSRCSVQRRAASTSSCRRTQTSRRPRRSRAPSTARSSGSGVRSTSSPTRRWPTSSPPRRS